MKSSPRKSQDLLLVTTDPRVPYVVHAAAEKLGFRVHLLEDCVAAYYRLRGNPNEFDLALIDIDPGMPAVALLSVALEEVPVIVATSIAGYGLAEIFRYRGKQCCLSKPLRMQELIGVIEQALTPGAIAV